jgi:hypothetical protein
VLIADEKGTPIKGRAKGGHDAREGHGTGDMALRGANVPFCGRMTLTKLPNWESLRKSVDCSAKGRAGIGEE